MGIQVDFEPSKTDIICSMSRAFSPLANLMDVGAMEKVLGHEFTHKGLLVQAFVHPSYNNFGGCYQRLEYLGDAVLDYLVTSYLYTAYPELKPGQLTDLRSMSVSNLSLADVAGRWSIHKFVICDSSALRESMTKYVNEIGNSASHTEHIEERTCPKVLGDLVESCMGALLLDTGFNLNCLWKIMLSLLDPVVNTSKMQFNPLRELRELCQSYNWDLQFSKLKKNGEFLVEAKVDDAEVSATARASNINGKTAKRMAARQFLECLKAQGYSSKSTPLKDVLKQSKRQEAMLIGYNEVASIPKLVEVQLPRLPVQLDLLVEANFQENSCSKNPPAIPVSSASDADPHTACATSTVNARSHLNNICAAKHGRPPVFDCLGETGPDHLKQ